MSVVPPRGHGIYARAQSPEYLARFGFAVQMAMVSGTSRLRADLDARVRAMQERGVRVYLSAGPESWAPNVWPETAARLEEAALRLRCRGVVADPEGTGWNDLAAPLRDPQVGGLALALRHMRQSGLDVGVTSVPMWPLRGKLAQALDGAAWGSPQVYLRDDLAARPPAGQVMAEWRRLFGAAIPSVALWAGRGSVYSTEATYREYLAQLPQDSAGAIGWPPVGEPEGWRTAAYLAWSPGGVLPAVRDIISSTGGRVAIGVAAVLAVLALAWYVSR